MQREEIFNRLKGILATLRPKADLSNIGDGTQLVRDLGLDSLTVLLLALAAEKEFGIRFEGAPQFETVGEVINYIEQCQK